MPDFPTTGLLSSFLLPAENPLSESGRWAQATLQRPPLKKNASQNATNSQSTICYSYWTPETFGGDVIEVWGCSGGGQLGADLETWRVFAVVDTQSFTGYRLYYGGGIGKSFNLSRVTNVTTLNGICSAGGGYPSGLGMRINGDVVEAWAAYGDPHNPANWSMVCSGTDTFYRGQFYIGIGIEQESGTDQLGFSCFGGGAPTRSQFFRWTRTMATAAA